jgi:hypothetical protein
MIQQEQLRSCPDIKAGASAETGTSAGLDIFLHRYKSRNFSIRTANILIVSGLSCFWLSGQVALIKPVSKAQSSTASIFAASISSGGFRGSIF